MSDTTPAPTAQAGPCFVAGVEHEREAPDLDACDPCGLYVDYWPQHAALVAVAEAARAYVGARHGQPVKFELERLLIEALSAYKAVRRD